MILSIILGILAIIVILICIPFPKKKQGQAIENKILHWIEKNRKILFITIILIGSLVRIIGLGEVPRGINVDEAGMAYDAWALANYGVDRYTNTYPCYLINFNAGQSALYAYLTIPFIKLFGVSIWVLRLPALIAGIGTIALSYLIAKEIKQNKAIAIIFIALVAICPWNIIQSRIGLDCDLMAAFFLLSIYQLLKSKKWWHYLITGFLFGITLYTYILSWIVLPIFLILILGYLYYLKRINIKQIMIMAIPMAIMAIPLLLFLLINKKILPEIELPFMTIPKLAVFRQRELGFNNLLKNRDILKALFIEDDSEFTTLPQFGTMYYCSFAFLIVGIISSIKSTVCSIREKKMNLDTVFLMQTISILACICIIDTPRAYKANAVYPAFLYFTALGIYWVIQKKQKLVYLVLGIYLVSFIHFEYSYFTEYKDRKMKLFNEDMIELTNYLDKQGEKQIYFSVNIVKPYIYTLLANKMSPYDFYQTARFNSVGEVVEYDKYHFYSGLNKELADLGMTIEYDKDAVAEEISDDVQLDKDAIYVTNFNACIEKYRQLGLKEERYGNYYLFSYE